MKWLIASNIIYIKVAPEKVANSFRYDFVFFISGWFKVFYTQYLNLIKETIQN